MNILDSICEATSRAQFIASNISSLLLVFSIVELIVIVGLIAFLLAQKRKSKGDDDKLLRIKKEAMEGEIDMDNIMATFQAMELYKKLVRRYHPDRYPGDEIKMQIANEIAAKITRNKYNYKSLIEIEKEAHERLS